MENNPTGQSGTSSPPDAAPARKPGTADLFVVLGVTGTGKTTIGTALASRLGIPFADADDYHSEANKRKMASGTPLTDDDRQPWLEALNRLLVSWSQQGSGGVLACSALKQQYRDTLGRDLPPSALHWVLLDLSEATINDRLQHRHHEFMNPSLLSSQLAILERPTGSTALTVVNQGEPATVVDEIVTRSGVQAPTTTPKENHGTSAV